MNYNALVAPDTFIGRYLTYMADSETAQEYDFWCAVWLLSITCGRNIIVDRPRAPVFLNLYAILVAESGVTRKSSAVRIASEFANRVIEENPHIGVLEGKTGPEKLDEILHRRTASIGSGQLAISVSELATFLGTEQYSATMPALLTDLYDCPELRRGGGTLTRGVIEQHNVFVSFLSASTPAWLMRSVNPNVIQGGFTSRCLFIISERPKRKIAWAQAKSQLGEQVELIKTLRHIHRLALKHRTILLTDGALRSFRMWYNKRKPSHDAYRSSFESREDGHILRLAAFLCINDDMWVIQHQHIRTAIRLIEGIKLQSARLFAGTNVRSKFVLGVEAARDALIAAGMDAIPRSQLYLKCRSNLDNREFAALMDVLHEMGAIQRFELRGEGRGRPVELIRATKLLVARGLTERLVERFT